MGIRDDDCCNTRNAFLGIADKCGLSERTVRMAFARKPVTWRTARIIANAIGIDIRHFRIKDDERGRKYQKHDVNKNSEKKSKFVVDDLFSRIYDKEILQK